MNPVASERPIRYGRIWCPVPGLPRTSQRACPVKREKRVAAPWEQIYANERC